MHYYKINFKLLFPDGCVFEGFMISLRDFSMICLFLARDTWGRGGICLLALGFCLVSGAVSAASLPRDEPYQQVLCDYLGSLKESDFDPGQEREDKDISGLSGEALYMHWLLSQRGGTAFGMDTPSSAYLLASIESGDQVIQPKGLGLARFAKINPDKYENPRALRLRGLCACGD